MGRPLNATVPSGNQQICSTAGSVFWLYPQRRRVDTPRTVSSEIHDLHRAAPPFQRFTRCTRTIVAEYRLIIANRPSRARACSSAWVKNRREPPDPVIRGVDVYDLAELVDRPVQTNRTRC